MSGRHKGQRLHDIPKPRREELRRIALRLLGEDWKVGEVALQLDVGEGTISQWLHRQREKEG